MHGPQCPHSGPIFVVLPTKFEARPKIKAVASALSKWSMLDVWIAALVAAITSVQISVVTCTGTLLKGTALFFVSQLLAGVLLVAATSPAAVVTDSPTRMLSPASRSVAYGLYQRRGKLAVAAVSNCGRNNTMCHAAVRCER
jgi:hypothetical protein